MWQRYFSYVSEAIRSVCNHTNGEPSGRVVVVAVMAQRDVSFISSARLESSSGDRDITHIWTLSKDEFGGHCGLVKLQSDEYQIWEVSCTFSSEDS
jgi:hypothetical protein